ncbi:MAG: hypothetical protein ACLSUW_08945 [Akkermansia sp.]
MNGIIPPMITDFRLKVFETVARRLNFTRAAEGLSLPPSPAM